MPLSPAARSVAGLIFVLVPTVEIGGLTLLWFIRKRIPGYLDNPVRRALFRAGHAHAGVWVILALVGILYTDQAAMADGTKVLVRWLFLAAPILASAGFFLSVAPPNATRPNGFIALVYLGGISLAIAVIAVGIGLL